jgi:hypothetical protein
MIDLSGQIIAPQGGGTPGPALLTARSNPQYVHYRDAVGEIGAPSPFTPAFPGWFMYAYGD